MVFFWGRWVGWGRGVLQLLTLAPITPHQQVISEFKLMSLLSGRFIAAPPAPHPLHLHTSNCISNAAAVTILILVSLSSPQYYYGGGWVTQPPPHSNCVGGVLPPSTLLTGQQPINELKLRRSLLYVRYILNLKIWHVLARLIVACFCQYCQAVNPVF